jgi:hypothetical protein
VHVRIHVNIIHLHVYVRAHRQSHTGTYPAAVIGEQHASPHCGYPRCIHTFMPTYTRRNTHTDRHIYAVTKARIHIHRCIRTYSAAVIGTQHARPPHRGYSTSASAQFPRFSLFLKRMSCQCVPHVLLLHVRSPRLIVIPPRVLGVAVVKATVLCLLPLC